MGTCPWWPRGEPWLPGIEHWFYEHMIAGRSFPPFTGSEKDLGELRRRLAAHEVR